MDIFAVRGATTIESDNSEEISKRTSELISELVKNNGIDGTNIRCVSVIVSSTMDIKSFFPARAIRESQLLPDVPLFSCIEPDIVGALPLCIRVMLTLSVKDESSYKPYHIYLHGAMSLRPDLSKK